MVCQWVHLFLNGILKNALLVLFMKPLLLWFYIFSVLIYEDHFIITIYFNILHLCNFRIFLQISLSICSHNDDAISLCLHSLFTSALHTFNWILCKSVQIKIIGDKWYTKIIHNYKKMKVDGDGPAQERINDGIG